MQEFIDVINICYLLYKEIAEENHVLRCFDTI